MICLWPTYPYALEFVTVLSFLYMFLFLLQNIYIVWKTTPDLGLKLFIEGFIFGVNIPSILAFVLIILMYEVTRVENSELFLNGGTALLVFISSAASICIDHYGKPFAEVTAASCVPLQAAGSAAAQIVGSE